MNKRKTVNFEEYAEVRTIKKTKQTENIKKHSLDSDEEDINEDEDNIMSDDEFEGEEDGIANNDDGVRTTAFNMREELEEGHFDKDGHFVWKKEKEIRDNWLDNIDWQQIKTVHGKNKKETKGLADDSDSDEEDAKIFNEIESYKEIIQYMEPKENISKTLRRLGGGTKKLSTVERLKLKKAGLLGQNEKVIRLTEIVNNFLNQTGNMDIYQETYEMISVKISASEKKSEPNNESDMFSDDFETQEKGKNVPGSSSKPDESNSDQQQLLMWEYKVKQDSEDILGPKTTEQMQNMVDDGTFKDGVWVRKCGQDQFYSSSRIDFELYLS